MTQWNKLTDEDRERAMKSMPDMLEGFLNTWGWLHFAKAIEDICKEKNAAPAPDVQPAIYPEEARQMGLEEVAYYTHPPAADVRELVDALRGVVEVMEPLSPLDSLRYHTAQEVLKKWEPE
jgi:hypothetical protein